MSNDRLAEMPQKAQKAFMFYMYASIRCGIQKGIRNWNRKMKNEQRHAKLRLEWGPTPTLKERFEQSMQRNDSKATAAAKWTSCRRSVAKWKLGVLHDCPQPMSDADEAKLTKEMLDKIGWPQTTPPEVIAKAVAVENAPCSASAQRDLDKSLDDWEKEHDEECLAELVEQMPASPPV